MPIADAREIIADNAALLAEAEALNAALAEERKQTAAIIEKLNEYIAASEKERKMYEAKIIRERTKSTWEIIGALIIGAAIGAACH